MQAESDSTDCTECQTLTRRTFLKTTAAATATAAAASAPAAAAEHSRADLDFTHDMVPNARFAETLKKRKHLMADFGTDLLAYADDQNETAQLPGDVDDTTSKNVVTLRADKMQGSDQSDFPRGEKYDKDGDGEKNTDLNAIDAVHWATYGADALTGVSATVEKGNTEVDSVRVSSSGLGAGQEVGAEFIDVLIDQDVEKRYLQLVVNVDSLASGAIVEVQPIASDTDYKAAVVDAAASSTATSTIATATGTGIVFQERLADLATTTGASGDGTLEDIDKVRVAIKEADADVTLTALNAERTSRWEYGTEVINEDTDDEDTKTLYAPSGSYTVRDLAGLTGFDDAEIYDMEIPVFLNMGKMDADLDFDYTFNDAPAFPSMDHELHVRSKLELPSAYDLTHQTPSMTEHVDAPADRFQQVQTAAGVKDTDFDDIADSSWSDHTASYDAIDKDVSLLSTVDEGTIYAYEARILVTKAERREMKVSRGGGGAFLSGGGSGVGGFFGNAKAWIASIIGGGAGYFLFFRD